MSNVELERTIVEVKKRKLKTTWTLDRDFGFTLPSNKFTVIDEMSRKYPYGLDGYDVSFDRIRRVKAWMEENFADDAYRFEGDYTHRIWFTKEKHRTMTLLKWS